MANQTEQPGYAIRSAPLRTSRSRSGPGWEKMPDPGCLARPRPNSARRLTAQIQSACSSARLLPEYRN